MNIYDRIINILLEAKVEDYLSRLDEATGDATTDYLKQPPFKRKGNQHIRKSQAKDLKSYKDKNPIGSPAREKVRTNRLDRPYGRPKDSDDY